MNDEETIGIQRELREYQNEKRMQERILNAEQLKIATMLKNGMGKDMKEVLEGKKKIKLTWREKWHYKIRRFKEFFSNLFGIIFEIL